MSELFADLAEICYRGRLPNEMVDKMVEKAKAPKEQQASFFHEFKGEWLNEDNPACYGKKEVTVFYENRINEIWVEGIKVDFSMPWQSGNIYTVAEAYLTEKGEM